MHRATHTATEYTHIHVVAPILQAHAYLMNASSSVCSSALRLSNSFAFSVVRTAALASTAISCASWPEGMAEPECMALVNNGNGQGRPPIQVKDP